MPARPLRLSLFSYISAYVKSPRVPVPHETFTDVVPAHHKGIPTYLDTLQENDVPSRTKLGPTILRGNEAPKVDTVLQLRVHGA